MLLSSAGTFGPSSVPPPCFSDGPLQSSAGRNSSSREFLLASGQVERVGPVPPQASVFPGHKVVASAWSRLSACALGGMLLVPECSHTPAAERTAVHTQTLVNAAALPSNTHTHTHTTDTHTQKFHPSILQVVFPPFTSRQLLPQSCRMAAEKQRRCVGLWGGVAAHLC